MTLTPPLYVYANSLGPRSAAFRFAFRVPPRSALVVPDIKTRTREYNIKVFHYISYIRAQIFAFRCGTRGTRRNAERDTSNTYTPNSRFGGAVTHPRQHPLTLDGCLTVRSRT